jgi:nitrate reductase assembly molybdenum cofactor insertion protein NarJ
MALLGLVYHMYEFHKRLQDMENKFNAICDALQEAMDSVKKEKQKEKEGVE